MSEPTTYDLMLLLDLRAEQDSRTQALEAARSTIEASGEIVRHDEWGTRPLAYQIDHRTEAEYHLLQFHVTDTELLERLDRSLIIADGVLRFMITKVLPGTPPAPSAPSVPPASGVRTHAEPAERVPA